jgi:hypothetical protein
VTTNAPADHDTIPMHLGEVAWGWEAIARVLGRSVDTAQRLERQNVDPLPVFWELGRVGAFVHAVLAYRARNRKPLRDHRELVALRAEVGRLRKRRDK